MIWIKGSNSALSRKCLMRFEGWSEKGRGCLALALRLPHARMCQTAQQVRLPALNNLVFPGAENGTFLWTPKSLEPFTLEILARNVKDNLSSVLQPKTVVCACREDSQCLYNQTSRMGISSLEVSVGRRVREKQWGNASQTLFLSGSCFTTATTEN